MKLRDQRQHWLEMKYVEGRFREDYVVPEVYNPYIDLITPKLGKIIYIPILSNELLIYKF